MTSRGSHAGLARGPLLALALLAALWSFARSWNYAGRWASIDFYQFWVIGDVVREGAPGDIWSAQARTELGAKYAGSARDAFAKSAQERPASRRLVAAREREELETFSTPWLYTVFALAGDGRYRRDQTLFQRASLCLYVLGLLALASALRYCAAEGLLLVAVLLQAFGPFLEDESLGNVSRFQFALLAAVAALLTRRTRAARWAGGVVLGLAVAFKPNIAPAAVVLGVGWVVSGQWRKLGDVVLSSVLGALLAVACSSFYFGTPECWVWWWRELATLLQPGAWGESNYSLARLLREHAGIAELAFLGPALGLGVLGSLWVSRTSIANAAKASDERSIEELRQWDVLLLGLGVLLGLLASELTWFHYYGSALILVLYLMRPWRAADAPASSATGGGTNRMLAVLGLFLLSLETLRMLFELPTAINLPIVVAGALLLFACGCWSAARGLRAP